jgi:hypothetical protein
MTKAPTQPPVPPETRVWFKVILIVLAAAWIYGPALAGGWIWDDQLLIAGNPDLGSVAGLKHIWSGASLLDYWPLTWTVFWLEWHLWGAWPPGYHFVSLAFHLGSAFLLWRLLARLGLRQAWLGALLLVVHPLMVETVAWASETKNTLSMFLGLASCLAWMEFEDHPRSSRGYLRCLLLYAGALLAKTSVIALPAVFLLYAWWKRGRIEPRDLRRSFPFFALALLLAVTTVTLQTSAYLGQPTEVRGLLARLAGAGAATCFYIGKFVWPVSLSPVYVRWVSTPPSLQHLATLPLLALLLAGLWHLRQKGWARHGLLGFGFFLLMLLPVTGLCDMGFSFLSWVADHLDYFPSLGLIALTVAALERWLRPELSVLRSGVVAVVLACLAWQSHDYIPIWNNPLAMWTYAYAHNPRIAGRSRRIGRRPRFRRAPARGGGEIPGGDPAPAHLPEGLRESRQCPRPYARTSFRGDRDFSTKHRGGAGKLPAEGGRAGMRPIRRVSPGKRPPFRGARPVPRGRSPLPR